MSHKNRSKVRRSGAMDTHEKTTDESTGSGTASSIPVFDESSSRSGSKSKIKSNKDSLQHDNRAVNWSRALVCGVLMAAAAVLSYLTYYYVLQEQIENFESDFADLAEEIIATSQLNVKKVFGVLDGLGVEATSQSLHDNASFPFVTIPNFAQRGEAARATSQALIIAYLPLVSEENRMEWQNYSVANQDWMEPQPGQNTTVQPIRDQIHAYGPKDDRRGLSSDASCSAHQRQRMLKERVPEPEGSGPYAPVWQMSPSPLADDTGIINYNLFDKPVYGKAVNFIGHTRKPVFLDVCNQAAWFGEHFSNKDVLQTVVVEPVFANFNDEDAALVGTFVAVIPWQTFFENIIQSRAPEMRVVLSNTCDEVFTFSVQGNTATFLEEEDLHDSAYENQCVHAKFADFANPKELLEADLGEHCAYHIHVYPTKDFEDSYLNNDPIWYCLVVLAVFVFTSIIFLLYDNLVQRRQMRLVEASAKKHELIVKSLFPEMVRSRVFDANKEMLQLQSEEDYQANSKDAMSSSAAECDEAIQRISVYKTKPIADLYPAATVLFADISGFTAWSSIRQPGDVFNLLEMVYHAFDASAKTEKIFKVETIGDCYVAVAGIPEPREDHAVAMIKFARICLSRFNRVIGKLEQVLGPDTSRMHLRLGVHSGPVTGGVLRNAKSRFQLFGDTVNTASRMESTGLPGKIQVSRETADLLKFAGKGFLLEARTDLVQAKGKGALQTYWIKSKTSSRSDAHQDVSNTTASCSAFSMTDSSEDSETSGYMAKMEKLVDWNCSLLLPHLKAIVARRKVSKPARTPAKDLRKTEENLSQKYMVRKEVKEVIDLPAYVPGMPGANPDGVKLDQKVQDQLRQYVLLLSSLYHRNAFHCFEHASHVAQSTTKMLARIVDAGDDPQTFGICDPLTQFSIILSALLHDANHAGIPNPALIQEDPILASAYNQKSVAEQQSVDLAWNALMDPEFEDLRSCIYCNETELCRFRQLIVNSVMATDIFDPELSALRKNRWNRVFSEDSSNGVDVDVDESTASTTTSSHGNKSYTSMTQEAINRKATLVLEHLIQASDVAHTMQHWKVYQEWNARLFEEMYTAYVNGRTDKDPSGGWYQGELWFFDNYVLPLGKKLKNCGVFGVSSDEFLNYGVKNHHEWEIRGEQIVAEMVAKLSAPTGSTTGSTDGSTEDDTLDESLWV